LVRHTGVVDIPKSKMSFVQRDDATLYAYGGEYPYSKTTETFNDLYKITFDRRTWGQHQIMFTHWELVRPVGDVRPPAAVNAPMVSFHDTLYVLTTHDITHTMYAFKYATVTRPAEWSRLTPVEYDSKVVNMVGNANGQLSVYFENDQVQTLTNESLWSRGAFVAAQSPVDGLVPGYSSGQKIQCVLEMRPKELRVGGLVIASYPVEGLKADVFLEEWLGIDILTRANAILRVHNAIDWQTQPEETLDTVIASTSRGQQLQSVDMVTRIHMHQARWSVSRDMLRRYELSSRLNEPVVHYVTPNMEPDEALLDFFSASLPVFFESVPLTHPSRFAVHWEGDTFERCLVIFGNYVSGVYEQEIDFERDNVHIRVSWSVNSFQLRLKNSDSNMVWYKSGDFKAFALVLHLEEWVYNKKEPFTTVDSADNADGWQALFQLFLSAEAMPTYNMQSQTASFLQYSPSHCALTGDVPCPGLLPFTNVPCSGHGRCSFSCQCTCEVAKSVLASSETALVDTDWTDSPWRGSGCEIVCPGYDGYSRESICSANGQCQRDGQCSCNQGYTGDACQFKCPVNEKNETCSLHGGCGTRSYDLNSYTFVNNEYLDILSAKNKEHYANALLGFYQPCDLENYIEQPTSFEGFVKNKYPAAFTLQAGKQLCSDINQALTLDHTNLESRFWPVGRCMGVRQEQEAVNAAGNELEFSDMMYVPVVLRDILTEYSTLDNIEQFDCQQSDCSIAVSEDDDSTLTGISFELVSPVFTFTLEYVHGASKGQQLFKVNAESFTIETDWNLEKCIVIMQHSVIVNVTFPVERIVFQIEDDVFTKKIYPYNIPSKRTNETVWIAPDYTQKYRLQLASLTGRYYNIPSSVSGEIRPLFTLDDAEKECDAEVECSGIIRFPIQRHETLYSLYTEESIIEDYTLNALSGDYDFLNKMSAIYTGKSVATGMCSTVIPGLAKYPSVPFKIEYNIPIANADVSLAKDEETGAVGVGNGIWTQCWTRRADITTKMACYQAAAEHNYGFAFSESTGLCLIYSGITDPNKIRLDKYNSESRLTKNNPCQQSETTWFT
jgi:hypothetical protein